VSVELALATPADVAELLPLMADFNQHEQIPWTPQAGEGPLRALIARPELGLVGRIREDGATLGYFVLTYGFDLEWGGRDAHLTELYLVPGARGAGRGRAALERILDLARVHGARAVHLQVRHDNAAARALYERAGFEDPQRALLTRRL
jgi:ribosomal protein S18 acetylase RimI-like enzyme